uniref:Uncharacterized protein n=1 Tax=Schistocephalus solidus TaxID=70667 RepID=A0A0X3PSH7_SCHSO
MQCRPKNLANLMQSPPNAAEGPPKSFARVNFSERQRSTFQTSSHEGESTFLPQKNLSACKPLTDSSGVDIGWLYSSPQTPAPRMLRLKVRDLIQQENCDNNFRYAVDQPSKLVRIECLKPGCRCVLKQEPALALKIVCNITLVRGMWSSASSGLSHKSLTPSITSTPLRSHQSDRSEAQFLHSVIKSGDSNKQSSRACLRLTPEASSVLASEQIPLILTSCFPFWFELLSKANMGPGDFCQSRGPSLNLWKSAKAVWKARPSLFLLLKPARCFFSTNAVGDCEKELKQDTSVPLNTSSVLNLHPGTMLRLIDCRICRIIVAPQMASTTFYPSFVSMLQCEVVGARSLARYASMTSLPPDDALQAFASGPRFVYLPLDDNSVLFSPIATQPPNARDINASTAAWPYTGAHSVLSLLSNFQLPISVRPLLSNSLANWPSSASSTAPHNDSGACLTLSSCYHGDLIFLEPISDCVDRMNQTIAPSSSSSRFFVVTTEMLSQHRFLVASPTSTQAYSQQLKVHASRVAHFLAAIHPAFGLNYLLKYLEDATHCSAVGPVHCALSETLGPPGEFGGAAGASHMAVGSIAAVTALQNNEVILDAHVTTTQDHYKPSKSPTVETDEARSLRLQAQLNEIDIIYQYVRTGRFPKSYVGQNDCQKGGVDGRLFSNYPLPEPPPPPPPHTQRRSTRGSFSQNSFYKCTPSSPRANIPTRRDVRALLPPPPPPPPPPPLRFCNNMTRRDFLDAKCVNGYPHLVPPPRAAISNNRRKPSTSNDYTIPYLMSQLDQRSTAITTPPTGVQPAAGDGNHHGVRSTYLKTSDSPTESGFFQQDESSTSNLAQLRRQVVGLSPRRYDPASNRLVGEYSEGGSSGVVLRNQLSIPLPADYQKADILSLRVGASPCTRQQICTPVTSRYVSAVVTPDICSSFYSNRTDQGILSAGVRRQDPGNSSARFQISPSVVCPDPGDLRQMCAAATAAASSFRTIDQLRLPLLPKGPARTSAVTSQPYCLLNSMSERVNSSPDTGLGGDSGPNSVAQPASASRGANENPLKAALPEDLSCHSPSLSVARALNNFNFLKRVV